MADLTVLYVEDEESDILFMRRAFERAGLGQALRAVVNGRQAIDYLAGNGDYADRGEYPFPAVVLLDLNLPVMSGFEVLKWARGRPESQALPIIVFSSSSRHEDKDLARYLGANDYVEKPNSGRLFSTVVEGLRQTWLGK
jgi:CheY-like chemotaxis protein